MPESSGSSVPGGMKDVLPQASHQAEMLSRTGFPIIELSLVISIFRCCGYPRLARMNQSRNATNSYFCDREKAPVPCGGNRGFSRLGHYMADVECRMTVIRWPLRDSRTRFWVSRFLLYAVGDVFGFLFSEKARAMSWASVFVWMFLATDHSVLSSSPDDLPCFHLCHPSVSC